MGYKYFEYNSLKAREAAGQKFEAATRLVATGKVQEAQQAFEAMAKSAPSGYGTLSRLRVAGALAEENKRAEAVAAYDAVAKDGERGCAAAGLRHAPGCAVEESDEGRLAAEMQNRLKDLINDGNAWRASARELLGLAAMRAGKQDEARKAFEQVLGDSSATPATVQRAQMMMTILTEANWRRRHPNAGDAIGRRDQAGRIAGGHSGKKKPSRLRVAGNDVGRRRRGMAGREPTLGIVRTERLAALASALAMLGSPGVRRNAQHGGHQCHEPLCGKAGAAAGQAGGCGAPRRGNGQHRARGGRSSAHAAAAATERDVAACRAVPQAIRRVTLVLPTTIRTAWSADVGQGSSKLGRLTASPIVADGRVYTLDAAGLVTALSQTGSVVWRASLTPEKDKDYKAFGGGLAAEDGRCLRRHRTRDRHGARRQGGKRAVGKNLGSPMRSAPTIGAGRVFV